MKEKLECASKMINYAKAGADTAITITE